LTSFVLAVPPQVIEVYRSIAQSGTFSDAGEQVRELVLGSAALTLVSIVIWLSLRVSAPAEWRSTPAQGAKRIPSSLGSAAIAVLPIFAMALGYINAMTPEPSRAAWQAATLALSDIVVAGGGKPTSELLNEVVARLLDYNWYTTIAAAAFFGLAIVLGAGLVLVDRLFPPRGSAIGQQPKVRVALSICAAAATILVLVPPSIAAGGPILVLCIFVAAATIMLTAASYWSDKTGIPLVGFVLVYVALISFLELNDSHRVYTLDVTPSSALDSTAPRLEEAFVDWLNARPDHDAFEGRRYPVYIVAAQGGGIYAAYHTASALGAMQDACPAFARHTFAISGVSGGSLGAAVFASLTNAAAPVSAKATREACLDERRLPRREAAKEFSFVRVADRILGEDYLSPVAYGLLFPDFVQLFVPYPVTSHDRARQFELALEKRAESVLKTEAGRGRLALDALNLLARPFAEHWQAKGDTPALVLNTTEVGTGLRRIIAPFGFVGDDVFFIPASEGKLRGLPLSTAAILSARFPWVTPPGWYYERESTKGTEYKNHLVDGGYYENSGVATALDIIRALRSMAAVRERIDVRLIILSRPTDHTNETFFGIELLAPVRALLRVRAARARTTIAQAEREIGITTIVGGRPAIQRINLLDMDYPPPLGWRLSKVTAFLIEAQNGRSGECVVGPQQTQVKEGRFDADCVLETIRNDLKGLQ
jgi:hypothetical protein